MLHLSDFTIILRPSNDYIKSIVIVYLFAVVLLLHSAFPLILMGLNLLILAWFISPILKVRPRSSIYLQLSHRGGHWFLQDTKGKKHRFEQGCVTFDGGIFILFTLIRHHSRKTLVIFNDQLTNDQYRLLRLVGVSRPMINPPEEASVITSTKFQHMKRRLKRGE